jgi:hypothetical protein
MSEPPQARVLVTRNIAHRLPHPSLELLRSDVTFPLYVYALLVGAPASAAGAPARKAS